MTVAELKKLVGNKKLILGTERTLKELKRGEVKKVFLAANCAPTIKEDIETYAKQHDVEVSVLDVRNEELGVVVKKPFAVSVIALLK
jgi:large subunit ribosomal protein L30e